MELNGLFDPGKELLWGEEPRPGRKKSPAKQSSGRTVDRVRSNDATDPRWAPSDNAPSLAVLGCKGAELAQITQAASTLGANVISDSEIQLGTNVPVSNGLFAPDLVVAYVGDAKNEGASAINRCLCRFPKSKVVVIGSSDNEALVDSFFEAGARGFIPSHYSAKALGAALSLVLEGEVFRPNPVRPKDKHPRSTSTANTPTGNSVSKPSLADYGLTKVEREVLALVAQGMTNFEIGQRRGGTEGTIKVHMNHIFNKLNVRSRCEAIAFYMHMHNVDPEELQRAESGNLDMKWLLANMTHEHHAKGKVLFRKGDRGDKIYYLQRGVIHLEEIGVNMASQTLFGEIAVFAPEHLRTCSAVCKTDVDVFTLSGDDVRRSYFLNPQFAFYIMYLITQRLVADGERQRIARS